MTRKKCSIIQNTYTNTFFADSFSVLRRIHTKIMLYVPAEISRRRKTEHIGYADKSKRLVTQQAGNVKCSIAVYPIIRSISAYFLRHLGQIFRRDAKAVGIIAHLAVLAINSVLQHGKKSVHYRGILRGYIRFAVKM